MKYILEIKPEYEDSFKGVMILEVKDSNLLVDSLAVENLEELNSDYINEHYGDLQDTAYQKGLNDAWECARELYLNCACKDLFGEYFNTFLKNHTAQEAIEKLKACKQDDKIEVGDEVNWIGDCFIVTRIFQPRNMKEQCDGIDDDGCVYSYVLMDDLKKTGRHFDIASILKEMQS